jgi:hypothetical protein
MKNAIRQKENLTPLSGGIFARGAHIMSSRNGNGKRGGLEPDLFLTIADVADWQANWDALSAHFNRCADLAIPGVSVWPDPPIGHAAERARAETAFRFSELWAGLLLRRDPSSGASLGTICCSKVHISSRNGTNKNWREIALQKQETKK